MLLIYIETNTVQYSMNRETNLSNFFSLTGLWIYLMKI